MSHLESREDECFILVKAQPHRSSNYFETVCCAGIGRDGKWRRQYPVPFRILEEYQKFRRWQWIEYEYTKSKSDSRAESQKVVRESLRPKALLKKSERAPFVNSLVRPSLEEARDRGESLTLVRPTEFKFSWIQKTDAELYDERTKHAEFAKQLNLFGEPVARPLAPCEYQFIAHWTDQLGAQHRHECDDWESVQAFRNFRERYGEQSALARLKEIYEAEVPRNRLLLAFSTHSRRQNQWLLVGLIRLEPIDQPDMFLTST